MADHDPVAEHQQSSDDVTFETLRSAPRSERSWTGQSQPRRLTERIDLPLGQAAANELIEASDAVLRM